MSACLKPFSLKVPQPAPAAWWKMEEAAGDRIDAVHGLHLPLASGLPAGTQTAGKVNFGMNFSLVASKSPLYATASTALLAYQGKGFDQYSWVKLNGFSGPLPILAFNDYIIQDAGGATILECFLAWNVNSGALTVVGGGASLTPAFSPTLGSWHLIRFYYDAATDKMGVQIDNGPKQETVPLGLGLLPSPKGGVDIAPFTGPGSTLNISIDEYSIWLAQAPSDATAAAIWNGGAGHGYPL